jgi:GDP-4-dehydro-6-deoxy-D-mannose reductase
VELHRDNVRATDVLLRALARLGRRVRCVLVGSAAEYGPVPEGALPASEATPCRPEGAYALSKWAATRLAQGVDPAGGVEVVAARLFNPIGPGLPEGQAFGRFAARLAREGSEPVVLEVGDLAARRDFVDVRDAARGLIALAREGRAGAVYPLGRGEARSVGEGLGVLVRLSGLAVRVRCSSAGTGGPSVSVADVSRLLAETSWRPAVDFERSLADLWADAVERERAGRRRVA